MKALHASQRCRIALNLRHASSQSVSERDPVPSIFRDAPASSGLCTKLGESTESSIDSHGPGLLYKNNESSSRLWESLFAFAEPQQMRGSVAPRYSRTRTRLETRNPKQLSITSEKQIEQQQCLLSEDLTRIEALWHGEASIPVIWEACVSLPFFQRKHYSAAERLRLKDARIFANILKRVAEESTSKDRKSTPRLSRVVVWYQNHGLLDYDMLNDLFRQALFSVVSDVFGKDDSTEIEHVREEWKTLELLQELLQIWQFCMQHSLPQGLKSPSPGKNRSNSLYRAENIEGSKILLTDDYFSRFNFIFPAMQNCISGHTLAAYAAITYLCYHRTKGQVPLQDTLAAQIESWISSMSQAMTGTKRNASIFREVLPISMVAPEFVDRIEAEYAKMFLGTENRLSSTCDTPEVPRKKQKTPRLAKSSDASWTASGKPNQLFVDLRKATRDTNIHRALTLWKRFLAEQLKISDTQYRDTMLTEFLWSFVRLGLIRHVLEIWNMLTSLQIKPTPSHWAAMIEACKRHRDLISLKSIWTGMVSSGEYPKNSAWTTYINALLFCRDVKGALTAVNEMGKVWDLSSLPSTFSDAGPISDDLQPSILPINAALSGLIDMYRSESTRSPYIESILAWSRRRHVLPNIETFNILLRPAARSSNHRQVQQILADIRAHGCTPDVVTFTILIDGVFRNPNSSFKNDSVAMQHSNVEKVFADMELAGINPNARTYSTILDSLLSGPHSNLAAAQVVLKRMGDQQLKVSSHIYTILIHHYFASSPPNFVAVDAVWRRIEFEHTNVDHVFFDRMVEGYARLGETEKMLSFLRIMSQKGKAPGWVALTMALKALIENEEWDFVEEIVSNVEHKDGYAKLGAWGWHRQGWDALVADLRKRGLISRKGGDT